ncbi:MAG: DUF4301 family protein [Crocinitomicaceae bacterium]|nr:DUF4301 family protein [Crocinitomicaceae bacterium]
MGWFIKDTILKDKIEIQRLKLQKGNPFIELIAPCTPADGIKILSEEEKIQGIRFFEDSLQESAYTFFVPASGSGSRMFELFFSYLENPNPDTENKIKNVLHSIQHFAFYDLLNEVQKKQLNDQNISIKEKVRLLVTSSGINMGAMAKGLIPFHRYAGYSLTPFQEHILQGKKIAGENVNFHFTISPETEIPLQQSFDALRKNNGISFRYVTSVQNPETDSIAFDADFNPVSDQSGKLIMRPSGHGALLENLNDINSDYIFIRNIDNIQHQQSSAESENTRKALAGLMHQWKNQIFEILRSNENGKDVSIKITDVSALLDLKFPKEKLNDREYIHQFFNRPVRICGMVKNTGQPGGGPFWIKDEKDMLSKQIIEKSQISAESEHILQKATHFNPVELICSVKNYLGEKFDLLAFRNENTYFIVKKSHQGKPIQYTEEPGLWNGSMHNWITIFCEISSDCFSPVKSFEDLDHPLHQPAN